MPLSKALEDGILEFRKEPKGKRVRGLYFYDAGRVIVCTTAFMKDKKTPRAEIDRAHRLRRAYLDDQRLRRIEVLDLPLKDDPQ